jgi:hypothetical protein
VSNRPLRTIKTWFFGYRFWDVLGLNTWKADAALGGIPGTRPIADSAAPEAFAEGAWSIGPRIRVYEGAAHGDYIFQRDTPECAEHYRELRFPVAPFICEWR